MKFEKHGARLRTMTVAGLASVVALTAAASVAKAAPVTFSFSPGSASTPLGGSTPTQIANDAIVGANNYNVADFSAITINTTTGAFTEVGALNILNFLNGGSTVTANGLGSAGNGSTGYSLYLSFNATGTQGPIPTTAGGVASGVFTGLTYELIGTTQPSPPLAFNVTNGGLSITDAGPNQVLAYGSLVPNTGFIGLTNTGTGDPAHTLSPSANLNLTFNECLAAGQGGFCTSNESGFFTSPAAGLNLQVGNFSANTTVTTFTGPTTTGGNAFLNLVGGAGNLTFVTPVPEPGTMGVIAVGLIGLAAAVRRRSAL